MKTADKPFDLLGEARLSNLLDRGTAMTLRDLADICAALGLRPKFSVVERTPLPPWISQCAK